MALEGKGDQLKGDIKEAAGDLTGNDQLKNEGKADQLGGEIKEKLSEAGDAVKDKFNEVAAKVEDKREEHEAKKDIEDAADRAADQI
ncbi:CsbD family protein [Corynebacterium aquatimens]|uniref:CsbD family protein n=1 Tax=Corynebacterium TaxID=1716 RepID=UPI001F2DF567|nr:MULTISPECIES: CsbD family protein [Corynebacterium]QYH18934.1 CsbD family protein [Corynebacterium aquatimens]UIZ92236.1 CsbD family protein [Corynebacterium sp. CNCTC7651]UIZ92265.1 CsbD family protein [Corynebacterium sp. CNCTC7651]